MEPTLYAARDGPARRRRKDRRHSTAAGWQHALARVLWCEPFWIGLLAPSVLFPGRFWVASWQPALVLLLFLFWPLRLAAPATLRGPRLFTLPAAALALATGWAILVSPAPAASWEAAGYLLLGVALALALVLWPPVRARPPLVAWLLLLLGAAVAIAGPLLLGAIPAKFGLGALIPAAGRLVPELGETVNPNVLGGALLIPSLLAIALALGPRTTRRPWRWVYVVLALALLAILVLTQCRGAWLALAAGSLLLVTLRWPRLAWLTVPAALVGAVLLSSGAGLALMLDAIGGAHSGSAAGSGLDGRLAIWRFGLAVAAADPLHGAGLGLFAAVQPAVSGVTRVTHGHNLFLQVVLDLGVLGLAAWLGVLAGVAVMLVRLLRRRPAFRRLRSHDSGTPVVPPAAAGGPPAPRVATAEVYRRRLHWTLAAGAAAAATALLVHGLVDAALWGNKAAFLPWLLFALVASLYAYQKERL